MKARLFILTACILAAPAFAQDLASLQGQMVRISGDIRRIETRLQALDTRLEDLKIHGTQLEEQYQRQRGKMAAATAAMTRMRRIPKEAVLIRPGGPLQAARTSMLLQASLPALDQQAREAGKLLTDLQMNRRELEQKTLEARAAKGNLDGAHAKLAALLDKRQGQGFVTDADQAEIDRLARDARSLRDLLTSLSDDQDQALAIIPQGLLPDMNVADGILPVSGIIRTRFGQKDDIGAKASGLTIESLAGALVVAPLPGVVRFSGTFKGYGNIVIVAHSGGYHSLLAGLGTIYVKPGQSIVSGEPIGILDSEKNQTQGVPPQRRSVYYELRQHGTPVDPARKLPDLG